MAACCFYLEIYIIVALSGNVTLGKSQPHNEVEALPAKCGRFHNRERPRNLREVTHLAGNWDSNPEHALLTTVLLSSRFVSLLKYYLSLHCKLLGRDCVVNVLSASGELSLVLFFFFGRRCSVNHCFTDLDENQCSVSFRIYLEDCKVQGKRNLFDRSAPQRY